MEADNGGVVLTAGALGEAPPTGAAFRGVSSWAGKCEVRQIESSQAERTESRAVIGMTSDNDDFCVVGQAHRLPKIKERQSGAPALQFCWLLTMREVVAALCERRNQIFGGHRPPLQCFCDALNVRMVTEFYD